MRVRIRMRVRVRLRVKVRVRVRVRVGVRVRVRVRRHKTITRQDHTSSDKLRQDKINDTRHTTSPSQRLLQDTHKARLS